MERGLERRSDMGDEKDLIKVGAKGFCADEII